MNDVKQQIEKLIKDNKVFLFMKGNKMAPQCGFSAQVLQILNHMNCEFEVFNVLEDEAIREGIKVYSDWPTIPQLYVNSEFIGGCDIVTELFENQELAEVLNGEN